MQIRKKKQVGGKVFFDVASFEWGKMLHEFVFNTAKGSEHEQSPMTLCTIGTLSLFLSFSSCQK